MSRREVVGWQVEGEEVVSGRLRKDKWTGEVGLDDRGSY